MKLQDFSLQVFLKEAPTQVLSCEVWETFKNAYFQERVQKRLLLEVLYKKLFLKKLQYSDAKSS